ncbi:response regulator transcription factor [Bacillus sp. CGMCC 1.16607]|uniref:response regulator transcription factor n=1 Tax=Bacillus sp. CGMCC 1.16607 TaxID=3351842 RepID=UPI00363D2E6E
MEKKMLIIEENSQSTSSLFHFFEAYFSVKFYNNGLQGLINAIEWCPNVIIINHSLTNVDSLELCRQIREKMDTIIIIVGKTLTEDQKIQFYHAGAFEVYEFPISNPVLLCKIKVSLNHEVMKRYDNEEEFRFGKLLLNRSDCKVLYGKKELNFTKKEFHILWILAKNKNAVVTREKLLNVVWSYSQIDDDRIIDTHLNRLRKKLKQNHINLTIKTVWGIGHKLQFDEIRGGETPLKLAVE